MSFNTISVIGLGYIGLPTAGMFASCQKNVVGVDTNEQTVETVNRGEIHIVEPGLDTIVKSAVFSGHLRATTKPEPAEAFLIAVPTPFKTISSDVPEPDLSYIEAAAYSIAPVLKQGDLVILESTSPVGTTEQLVKWLSNAREDLAFPQENGESADIYVAYCPERVLPGRVIEELVLNDRIIGGITPRCSDRAKKLYNTFVQGECVVTSARMAEMVKITENSCRDVEIAFANELSIICDKLDIDIWELISLANRHPRINILQPGPGVGGHCIAVDPWFIVSKTPNEAKIIRTAREINDQKPSWVLEKVKKAIADYFEKNVGATSRELVIACYGATFKPDIDDLRESPSLNIVQAVGRIHQGSVLVIEPNIKTLNLNENIHLVDLEFGLLNAHIHIMLVDHKEFKGIEKPNGFVIDVKGIWRNDDVR
jgi:UDP-N-acetyl-D-mannosaminuronic acid dehydrogenase